MKRETRNRPDRILIFIVIGLLVVSVYGCSRLSNTNRQIGRADQYFDTGSYAEAEIEYKNVLQGDPLNAHAITRLGMIYFDQGSPRKALPYLLKGNELQPDNLELRKDLGKISLERGDGKNAQDQAKYILAHNPRDPDAPLLLAEASLKPIELEQTAKFLSQLDLKPEDRAGVLVALGYVALRQNKPSDAEIDFRKAIAIDPKSSEANFGLGSMLWQKKDLQNADRAFAEAYKLAPPHSRIRLRYAQFKIQTGDGDGAQHILEELIKSAPDYQPALMMLADLDLAEKKYTDASALVGKVLQRDAADPEALLLGARIKLTQGSTEAAVADLERVESMYPKYAPVYYWLGQAYIAAGDARKAVSSLNQAVTANPNNAEAVLLLATINLKNGDFRAASASLDRLVKARPDLFQAQLLKAEALRGEGDVEGTLEIYRALARSRPKDPQIPLYAGMTMLEQNNRDGARALFNKSLEVSPAFMPAVEQLIDLDLAEKKFSEAQLSANSEIEKNPNSEIPRLLLAKVYFAQDDHDRAEAELLKVVAQKPDSPTAYFMLAQLYEGSNRPEKALANLQEVVAKNPRAVGALMMIAVIYDSQKNYPAAKDAYEKVLSVNPRFNSALNNLAYLYSEKFNELDKGFDMAQRAREVQPGEPHTADTLGWIVYKRRQYPWALSLLQESATKLPTESAVQFHLGMANYMMGNEEAARAAFQRALQLAPGFAGAEDAKDRLSILAIDPVAVSDSEQGAIEERLSGRADDPVALARLAALYEHEGSVPKAVSGFEAALKLNPTNENVSLRLIHLYTLQQDTKHAMDLAKDVHKLDPDNPDVSGVLGRLAFKTGDYQWAYSLLKETVHAKPNDPGAQFDFANSAFSVGNLPEAQDAMRQAIQDGISGAQSEAAKTFLSMVAAVDAPARSGTSGAAIEAALAADPLFAPALMARATAEESNHDTPSAVRDYEKTIQVYPDFSPAKRRLAILYSQDSGKDQTTVDLAMKAREAYPEDAELEKALGVAVYRQKDFGRAEGLLRDSALRRTNDAELLFYLGASEVQNGHDSEGRKSLKRALDLGLDANRSGEAQKILASTK